MLGHFGATSLKNLTKRKEVRKLEKELMRPSITRWSVEKMAPLNAETLMVKTYYGDGLLHLPFCYGKKYYLPSYLVVVLPVVR